MPIISSQITTIHTQMDGTRQVREEHDFGGSEPIAVQYLAQAGDDLNANMLNRVSGLNTGLKRVEIVRAIKEVRQGTDPMSLVFVEQSLSAGRKRIFKTLIKSNVDDVMLIAPTADSLTDIQLGGFLDISGQKLVAVRDIINRAMTINSDFMLVRDDATRREINNG